MKILLTAINAKYIHTNLALRSIRAYLQVHCLEPVSMEEFTINQTKEDILRGIYAQKPDVLAFSCYLWNIEMVKKLMSDCKKILPHVVIVLGGPEVSFETDDYLFQHGADYIVSGEGERAFSELIADIRENRKPIGNGISCLDNRSIRQNSSQLMETLDEIPFPYQDTCLEKNKIIYYESSRGCPYRCQYCLSSDSGSVRFRSLGLVKKELSFFLTNKVRQVKFVDRTFNCDKKRAIEIWRFLMEHDNQYTNFHFELAGDLLEDTALELLSHARPGLFRFEIGVQTTNEQTAKEIGRSNAFERISDAVRKLAKKKNILLHLDLIAGMPHEDYCSFSKSFNDVIALSPYEIQLGFLKVLKGSILRSRTSELELVYSDNAPYGVFSTPTLSFAEIERLRFIAETVERYYNSHRFEATLSYAFSLERSPFHFFEQLADFWSSRFGQNAASREDVISCLFEFLTATYLTADADHIKYRIKYDLLRHEPVKKFPDYLYDQPAKPFREAVLVFYQDTKKLQHIFPDITARDRLSKTTHIEPFPFDPRGIIDGPVTLLFDYRKFDHCKKARCISIDLF